MRILIADDDGPSRDLVEIVLRQDGHEAVRVSDGIEAWAALQQPDAPRVAILDWMMPGMDGLEVVRRVRELPADPPPYLIMLTARDEKADTVAALNAGANDYVSKPFNVGELRARVAVGCRLVEMQEALVESRRELSRLAAHDPLTGLLNRRAILERLDEEISRTTRHADGLAVAMCDIDHFKQVNDRHGHQTGDDLLRGLAQILSRSVREYDHVGRFGGEEFLLVMPLKAGADPAAVCERIRRAVAEATFPTRTGSLRVTVSIGVVARAGGQTVDELLTAADTALYRAKNEGRDRVVCRQLGGGRHSRRHDGA